ncbi:radical SAM protein [Clostridium beijerinckii]|jgi:DNA repair photolyase|uniref:Radical SAM protein n=2 Tax=Clostridium beijerinckii TaxID=1520 RepID=A0AAE2V019_CLOBE|nr:radical SAM protein [Clostridium beijerinckii]ABR32876.1 Radical SAM domain protein [Clostridium beijerinckii NCIMB 8052]AIU03495.1 radical SAM domain-containing protein [Clostridium beijerinckii ATCC 35702]MBF7807447.1 radical SAM protein [Clostridium beijerinckii]NOW88078.1 DNA repair photolyase [Clostridium beijerinckii]NRT25884.1 DNA repair photolyase [Clostridium beijerinckii]
MEEVKIVNWGISKDLQADIRYEPNACKGYVMDLSLGCPHHCIYCLFSPLELRVYKLQNPNYKGDVLPLKLDKFLKRTKFPPSVYLCYSSDPLGNDEIKNSTKIVLKKLFEHNVNVLFISKGIFDDSIIDVIKLRPDLMNVQVDVSSCDDRRNKIIEPGAPTYKERLKNLEKLSKIDGLASLVVRMDPLLPDIDDKEENITEILRDVNSLGVKEVVAGYMILTRNMKNSWERNDFTRIATKAFTEKTPTISQQELYSIPFDEKMKRLTRIREICISMGMTLSVCGCKDERFKKTDLEWICHPFNRKRREELNKAATSDMIMEIDHLI